MKGHENKEKQLDKQTPLSLLEKRKAQTAAARAARAAARKRTKDDMRRLNMLNVGASRATVQRELSRLFNCMRLRQETFFDEHKVEHVKLLTGDDLIWIDRQITLLKALLDAHKHAESLTLRETDRDIIAQYEEVQEMVAQVNEILDEKGIALPGEKWKGKGKGKGKGKPLPALPAPPPKKGTVQ